MKIPTKNKEKKSRLYRWFANKSANLSKRYVNDCHPVFMQYLAVNNITTASIWNNAYCDRVEKIWKLISSDEYKKYFFNAVGYNHELGKSPKPIPLKWYVRVFDKIIYSFSKVYVFLFEKELYRKIKTFEAVSASVVNLTKRVDKYIESTTPLQRLSRMQMAGIISRDCFNEDLDVLVNRISPDVIEANKEEKLKQQAEKMRARIQNAETFGSQWSGKKLPDLLKFVEKPGI